MSNKFETVRVSGFMQLDVILTYDVALLITCVQEVLLSLFRPHYGGMTLLEYETYYTDPILHV